MTGSLLLAAFAALACAIAYWQWKQAQKRREALFVFAVNRGWTFTVEDPSLTDRWVGAPFNQGDRRSATNVMRGTESGRSMIAFDYRYDTKDSDGDRTTHTYSVVVLGMNGYLPTLHVEPESFVDRIGAAVGFVDDIDLESEDFNRAFRVSAYDPKFASDVLSPRTMEFLLSRPAVAFRIQGTDVISWKPGSLVPVDLIARASTLDAVIDGIPEFVWKDNANSAG